MSVRDGQRLGVSGSVSVRVKCLVSHIHSEVCRLSYPLWSLAGRHVKRLVTALFSDYYNTHTHTHTRARAHARTHARTHTYIYIYSVFLGIIS